MNFYDNIVRQYYKEIQNYCCHRLNGNTESAKDCTQEVFLALHKKIHKFRLDDNIRAWLYEAARRETAHYISKNREATISLEEIPEVEDKASNFIAENNTVLDRLDSDERELIEAYYDNDEKEELANRKGLSMNAMYIRIHRIRKKLLGKSDNDNL